MIDFKRLHAHFDPASVSWRPGRITTNDRGTAGMALAYIDARDVMRRLDEVVGPENWSDSYAETAKGVMLCTLSLRIGGQWVSKTDGAGETDVEAEKGKVSDAFKRAAVKWGIGRYLYDIPTFWVECDPKSKQITKKGYSELERKLAAFGGQYVQSPLAMQSVSSAEVMDPQTGELLPPSGNVVREVIAAHAPEPEPEPEQPKPAESRGRPSYIPEGGKVLSAEERKAKAEREKAEEAAAFKRESRNYSQSWCDMLRETAEAAADAKDIRKLVSEFDAWELVRKAMWSKITPEDQTEVRKAYLAAKRAIDKRRASKAA